MTSRARQSRVRRARTIRKRILRNGFSRIERMNRSSRREEAPTAFSQNRMSSLTSAATGFTRSKMPLIFAAQRLFEVNDTGLYGFAGAAFGVPKLNSTFGGVSEPSLATKYGLG